MWVSLILSHHNVLHKYTQSQLVKLIHCTGVARLQSSVLLLSLEALFVPSLFSFLRSTADNKQCFVLLKVSDVIENVNLNIMKLLQTQFMWIS